LQNCVFLAKFLLLTGAAAPFGCGNLPRCGRSGVRKLTSKIAGYILKPKIPPEQKQKTSPRGGAILKLLHKNIVAQAAPISETMF